MGTADAWWHLKDMHIVELINSIGDDWVIHQKQPTREASEPGCFEDKVFLYSMTILFTQRI